MPRLSDTMEEGVLSRWLKKVGDQVHKGDVLAEIETDKATMDLESFEEGVLERLLVEAGSTVSIGTAVALVGDGSGADEPAARDDSSAPDLSSPPSVQLAQPLPAQAQTSALKPPAAPVPTAQDGRFRASPLARKVARDNGIDLATVTGTGPEGRVVRADITDAIAAARDAHAAAHPESAAHPEFPGQTRAHPTSSVGGAAPAPTPHTTEGDERIPLNNIRRITAARLTESQAVPHFSLTMVVDAEKLLAFRSQVNATLAAAGGATTGEATTGGAKISVNDLLMRAAALTIRAHPHVNSSWAGDSIVRHGRINVGFAVAIEDGLMVPVVTDADRKTLSEISTETRALAARARAGKLKPDEFSGGTFTISNLGMFGIDEFTAVINPPEAAILAVGAASPQPTLRDGQLINVPTMKITLTVDHRVLDGATAAAFLRDLTHVLEEPLRIVV
ncbi:2-oxo acid dehydrogenase subunit E2 [Nakamurella antarctica]|uniref:Dihydrolipoamide acetyltransferase component of pyruvate dehydrogenase complex n=2 Tax=Nakamurella antarctica TaxID=1902245 RepID=A0A3G8ZQS2_9ACTN|nr:2-oxo acid dehydrogenase subunit E2 [Nakamurella antarctica]